MPGIPTEAVKAQPCSGHDGLTQQAGVTAPVEQMRNYAVATVPLPTPGDHWASANFQGMPQILALEARRGPYRVLAGILYLGSGNEPTAALAQGHTVAGRLQSRLRTTSTPPTPGVRRWRLRRSI